MLARNVHNFRDDCLKDDKAPLEHVALFDEAQRAWNLWQTANFMQRRVSAPTSTSPSRNSLSPAWTGTGTGR